MDITITIDITVEHKDGTPHTSKEEIIAMCVEHAQTGAPQILTADNEGKYDVLLWDVNEA